VYIGGVCVCVCVCQCVYVWGVGTGISAMRSLVLWPWSPGLPFGYKHGTRNDVIRPLGHMQTRASTQNRRAAETYLLTVLPACCLVARQKDDVKDKNKPIPHGRGRQVSVTDEQRIRNTTFAATHFWHSRLAAGLRACDFENLTLGASHDPHRLAFDGREFL
jgi:hypothetical protein